jgi:selenide,water dikinase
MNKNPNPIKLTEYSHGAGCGCKISPAVLEQILASGSSAFQDVSLLVGNSTKDDAAAYDMGNGEVILSTTDFFMPIADDPHDFGRIAAANAISDIYAMGGTPMMAIAILGWPVDKLPAETAAKVIEGGRATCAEAGIALAGGHSIDSPEPIFGLAVTGRVRREHLRQNAEAKSGDALYLTKPLGIGILTTAQKQKILKEEHQHLARDLMCQLNSVGAELAQLSSVSAITDVTGFGLLGHLLGVCEGSGVAAILDYDAIPLLEPVKRYLAQGAIPGGTTRNFDSYGSKIGPLSDEQKHILCDPQTSGGLLVAVEQGSRDTVEEALVRTGIEPCCIGSLVDQGDDRLVEVR